MSSGSGNSGSSGGTNNPSGDSGSLEGVTAESISGVDFGAGLSGGTHNVGGWGTPEYRAVEKAYYDKTKNTLGLLGGGIMGLLGLAGIVCPLGQAAVQVGGTMFTDALMGKKAVDKALDKAASEHPEMLEHVEAARNEALAGFPQGTSTGNGEGASAAKQQTSSAKAAAAAAKAASDKAAADKAKAASDKAAATAKAVADKAKTDEEAKTKATLLAKRRQSSRRYYTSGGAQGLLGQAPVRLKTLLGE